MYGYMVGSIGYVADGIWYRIYGISSILTSFKEDAGPCMGCS